jgi:hypothetical protein
MDDYVKLNDEKPLNKPPQRGNIVKKKAKAKIHWRLFREGGRKQPPNPIYSTIIHFENDDTDW